jgi:hypothetical protein
MSKVASITRAGGLIVNPQHATPSTTQYARGYISEGVAVTDGLVLYLDASDYASYPGERSLAGAWGDYGSHQADYDVVGDDGVILLGTYTSWAGSFTSTTTATGDHTVMFDYWSDNDNTAVSVNNDGVNNDDYNATLDADKKKKTFSKTVNLTSTGTSTMYMRPHATGSKVYISNYRFFENGTAWNDLSGNGANLTFANAIPYDGSFKFDTTAHYAPAPTAVEDLKGDITMETWCEQYSRGGPHQTIICTDSSYRRGMKLMSAYHSYGGAFWVADGSGSTGDNLLDTAGGTLENTGVFHLVGTRNSSTGIMDLYLNGELSASTTHITGDVSTATNNGYIGREYHSGGSYGLKADVYLIRTYSKDLSAAQIKQNFNAERNRFGI